MLDLSYTLEWAHLLVRWLHLIAGVAWVGTSFYFIFLDHSLLPPKDQRDAEKGVGGEFWAVHGGGFYQVQKYRVAPESLPRPLHWFKWEAYTTWLSGFGLLVLLYYLQADVYLIDRSVADLAPIQAVALSIGILGLGWLVYDVLCRRLGDNELVLAGAIGLLITAVAFGTSQVFSARAVYIQVGAMIGTIMAANVFFVVIPGQRELVAAKQAGRLPDPKPGLLGKQRSVHNNYLTLPVLFAMISNHFPMTYGHPQGWLVLLALMAIGAWVRHFFNLRHYGKTVWAIPISGAVATVLLAIAIAPRPMVGSSPVAGAQQAPVEFAQVQAIVAQRCQECHSANPTYQGFTVAPKGVVFDTPEQIKAEASRIYQQAVVTRAMPLGNVTGMTQDERELLGAWVRQGARLE